ncbi:MAG: hypothetical protein J0H35_07270, partial [Rhodospirillales bacterium]|nr:hypothetical protein [Rhodospirillales bacterium]
NITFNGVGAHGSMPDKSIDLFHVPTANAGVRSRMRTMPHGDVSAPVSPGTLCGSSQLASTLC